MHELFCRYERCSRSDTRTRAGERPHSILATSRRTARLTAPLTLLCCIMFRKFSKAENIKTTSPVRSSEQRAIRAQILQQYPSLEEFVEDIFPKSEKLIMCKCKDYIQMVTDPTGELIFFQCRSGPFIPTLRFLHKCACQPPSRIHIPFCTQYSSGADMLPSAFALTTGPMSSA